jgi:hypothetical protein
MRAAVAAGVVAVAFTGCASAPRDSKLDVSWEQVEPLIAPFTYRMLIVEQCDPANGMPKPFDSVLAEAGAPEQIVLKVADEISRLREENSDNPDEYVCTPEMFEMSEAAAAEAQAAWDKLKG